MNRSCCGSAKTSFKKVTHVIFDLDGLLLDTEGINKKVVSEIAKEHGKVFTPEIHIQLLGRPDTVCSEIVVNELKLPISPDTFLHDFRHRSEKLLTSCSLMPGAERLVKHFHKNQIPIAIATSSTEASVYLKSGPHKELFSLFHHIVAGGSDPEVKRGKPNPDIFLICASRFPDNPKPEQCLVLEDAPNGVTAAISAGMQCIMVPDPHVPSEFTKNATHLLKSLEDIKPELFGLPALNGA